MDTRYFKHLFPIVLWHLVSIMLSLRLSYFQLSSVELFTQKDTYKSAAGSHCTLSQSSVLIHITVDSLLLKFNSSFSFTISAIIIKVETK